MARRGMFQAMWTVYVLGGMLLSCNAIPSERKHANSVVGKQPLALGKGESGSFNEWARAWSKITEARALELGVGNLKEYLRGRDDVGAYEGSAHGLVIDAEEDFTTLGGGENKKASDGGGDASGSKDTTGDDKVLTSDDKVLTSDDKVLTGDDKVLTGDDKVLTGDDKVLTGDDKVSTGDDKVLTGDDKVFATVLDSLLRERAEPEGETEKERMAQNLIYSFVPTIPLPESMLRKMLVESLGDTDAHKVIGEAVYNYLTSLKGARPTKKEAKKARKAGLTEKLYFISFSKLVYLPAVLNLPFGSKYTADYKEVECPNKPRPDGALTRQDIAWMTANEIDADGNLKYDESLGDRTDIVYQGLKPDGNGLITLATVDKNLEKSVRKFVKIEGALDHSDELLQFYVTEFLSMPFDNSHWSDEKKD